MLHALDEVYGHPVDIEYTVNLNEDGNFVVNLLQCRSLYTGVEGGPVELPEIPQEDTFFSLTDSSMGNSRKTKVDVVVQIDPIGYYEYPYQLKPQVAEAVRKLNLHYRDLGKPLMLMAPGRIGASSPELGVPVTFAAISGFAGICGVSDNRAGYMPELSYGSHLFQDLVEADIFYNAIWNDRRTLICQEKFFENCANVFPQICPDMESLNHIFYVSEPEDLYYYKDVKSGKSLCGYVRETK